MLSLELGELDAVAVCTSVTVEMGGEIVVALSEIGDHCDGDTASKVTVVGVVEQLLPQQCQTPSVWLYSIQVEPWLAVVRALGSAL